ncbi:MAG: adenosylcobalamin-dependent ribonucleoside-diphosphate reductase [Gammaproteobacteria bacterium]|jgi:ribonucleoside-diphosphate reductase alpha chain
MDKQYFQNELSNLIWDRNYRYRDRSQIFDKTIEDTWQRIATALSKHEISDKEFWQQQFYQVMSGFTFLPGGRIQAGCGTQHKVTLFNCFVMGTIEDSMDGIFNALKEGALTMQQGGGVGYDFSTLRPEGMPANVTGRVASGPVSFMHTWDAMCKTVLSSGNRRGAMMATLRCDHPDIETFIDAKKDKFSLRNFNLSVLVTDVFMEAVQQQQEWPLVFPVPETTSGIDESNIVYRSWSGSQAKLPCRIIKTIPATVLWEKIIRASYDYAEPGVLFIDRINDYNNLYYRETISATNPCGEIPLPPYGACNLGSINMTKFVEAPFSKRCKFNEQAFTNTVKTAVRILDNVIDLSQYPLQAQHQQAHGSRRIGLGITGLADTFAMLGFQYGDATSREWTGKVMRTLCHEAYSSSVELARERGPFPFFDKDKYLKSRFIQSLPDTIKSSIEQYGIRNSHLIAIAPTGTISLLANNVSSGIEPIFNLSYERTVLNDDGSSSVFALQDYAYKIWREKNISSNGIPDVFITAHKLAPQDHIGMQSLLQQYVDNAVSKTINIPEDYPFDEYKSLYILAYEKGLKGCTTFRPNPVTGEILSSHPHDLISKSCCEIPG